MELSAISRRGGSSGQHEGGAGLMPQQQQPQINPTPPRMLETTTFRPRTDAHGAPRPTQQPKSLQPGSNASGTDTSITRNPITHTPGVVRPQTANPNLTNLSATGTHLRYLGNTGSGNTGSGSAGSGNPGAPNAGTPNSNSGASAFATPPSPPRAIPPPPQPTTVSGLMQPMAFEVLPPEYEQKPVRTNSWLLALDDARAGRAGAEPVVADPSDLRRAPRVARPLDTSFSEPEPVTRRSAPWLVGLLLGVAACSLVFVFWSTLTHVDPKSAHTKVVPPVAPNPISSVNEELADPRDSGALRTKNAKSTSARSTQRPQPIPVTTPTASSTTEAPRALPRSRPEPMIEPLSAPPQQDIFTLPTPPSADSSTTDAPADPPDLAPAPNSSGGEQSSAPQQDPSPPPGATWWSGSLHATPLAVGESGPGADEYAASRERQALVGEWLMRQSRSASPLADTASVFPFVPSEAGSGQNTRAAACPNVAPVDMDRAPLAASTRERDTTPTRQSSADAERERAANHASASAAEPVSGRDTASEVDATPVSIVWEGSTVPAERITANARLLTPQVGRVRAGLRNGHAIEGRLYAVGTGNVWIDTDVGRLVLQRGEIERLEQVATLIDDTQDVVAETTPAPAVDAHADAVVAADNKAPAPSTTAPSTPKAPLVTEPPPRVRVRTPGGVFFGQIVAREGSRLTLLTDEGSRITLESDDIEAAPIAKAVVKRDAVPAAKPPASGGNPPQPH
jgi:hypothetical protein